MSRKVLLIEYEARSLERVRGLLPAPDFTVVEAHDGEEGLSAFTSSRFDLVVLSGMLPRLPSAEVIREIRRKGGATAPPILLMVSGYRGTNRKADAQRVGAFDILVKPFEDADFRDAVGQAIESTDVGARTMKISTAEAAAASRLTSEDIFSEVLQDVGGEASRPAPPPVARAAASTEEEVERRLRNTLSGILDHRTPPRGTAAPSSAPSGASPSARASSSPRAAEDGSEDRVSAAGATPPQGTAAARFSTDADIDRMIRDTLSGLRTPPKPKPGETAARAAGAAAPAAAVRAPDPDHFGQYEILERIASGGMADVYKARRSGVEGFQKIVAIKKILPHLADNEQFIAMFADEAKLAAQLSHPNVVHIYDLGKIEAGGYFIAMEYVDGRDLRAILQSARAVSTPMPVPLAIYVASKVASALDYAHRRRDSNGRELAIVHRDVSPQNILISYEGDIKLCDFGIAKAASKASTTQSGALKGKMQYMSPEQAWGRPIDHRSDLFSLGSVLFEMLTGEKLFRGDTDLSLLDKVRAAEVPAASAINPEVPRSLEAILGKTLAREPEDRYASASDLLRDLDSVLYSYTPAPGSADLAIYLHRLQAEEGAAEANARTAARAAATAEPPKKRRSKSTPIARRATGSGPKFVDELAASASAEASSSAKVSEDKSENKSEDRSVDKAAGKPAPAEAAALHPRAAGPDRSASAAGAVFGAPPAARALAEKKGRGLLYAGIAAAVLALAAVAWWLTLRPAEPGRTGAVPVTTPLPARTPTTAAPASAEASAGKPSPGGAGTAAATPVPPPAAAYDPKAVEAEVQRQLVAKKKELQKALEQPAEGRNAAPKRDLVSVPSSGGAKEETPVPRGEPQPTKGEAAALAEPTTVAPASAKASSSAKASEDKSEDKSAGKPPRTADAPEPASARPAGGRDGEVLRGDLVGPGPGVVEPALVAAPRVNYPPMARQQRISGRVVMLVLVDENGAVTDARLQQGIASKLGVNEAVAEAVRKSKFKPATKNGVPVKMWRTVVVDVEP